jgi:hypothetical protein
MTSTVKEALQSPSHRLVLAAIVALPLATTAYASVDHYVACTSPVDHQPVSGDCYCPDNHPNLVSYDGTCTCNAWNQCWIQNWQCGGGGGGGGS